MLHAHSKGYCVHECVSRQQSMLPMCCMRIVKGTQLQYRVLLDDTSFVAEPPGLGRSRARLSAAPLLRRSDSPSAGGALSAPWPSSARSRVSAWDTALARAALGVNTVDSSCPLTQRAARLLAHGRMSSTKHSCCVKWRRFVEFCTVTLPQLYLQRPRRPLPASPRTVLLYIAHLSDEGLVSESSLNPLACRSQLRSCSTFCSSA